MGKVNGATVECSECGTFLHARTDQPSEERTPCPTCGGTARTIKLHVEESITLSSMLGLKHKRPGHKKPLLEMKVGDSMSVDGTIAQIDQLIDRTVDPPQYRKRVVKADGTVVRDVSHPLSEHIDRGSAAKKPIE